MQIRTIPIKYLTPTDIPRDEVMKFYSILDSYTFSILPMPQVWLSRKELFISDGNNYVVFSAYKGKKEIKAELRREIEEPVFSSWLEETKADAKILKLLGVKSPYDLVPLVDWNRIENRVRENRRFG
ncbi:hypothetical protein J4466_03805 [Candidatus Pacearchaeota archaeon]|nr:hypothetical protein [Candidatus Pacearchaeota archaeon]